MYWLIFFLLILFGGCSSSQSSETLVQRVDPSGIYDTDITFSSEDLHQTVQKMVSSMLQNKIFDGTITIDVYKMQNNTDEHIDTQVITDSIKTAIIKSGKARFIDTRLRKVLQQELDFQNKNLYSDKVKAKIIGRQIGADYLLVGKVSSIKQRNVQRIDYYYVVTLELVNVENGTVDWIDEKKIKKLKIIK
jgi:uncharacterized protein (TIGR02722 family)